jgi:hypothetical protein
VSEWLALSAAFTLGFFTAALMAAAKRGDLDAEKAPHAEPHGALKQSD